MNRRNFIKLSASSLLGVTTLPHAQAMGPGGKNVIFLYMQGGMTHLDTFDPKRGHENQGPTPVIKTSTGEDLSGYLPRLAKIADKYALIRSLTSNTGVHQNGNYLMHTGYEKRASIEHPCLGAWITKLNGEFGSDLPTSIIIGSPNQNSGAGFLEPKHAPLVVNSYKTGIPNSILKGESVEGIAKKMDAIKKLEASFLSRYKTKNFEAYTSMYEDAVKVFGSSDLTAFDLTQEDQYIKDSYGDNAFGQGCLLARRLVEKGVRFVEVESGGWDTHQQNFNKLMVKGKELDDGLSALLFDLDSRGMLDDTVVVVATEFGRTPKINANVGRDHYPKAFSFLLAGGGIKGGQIYGKTSEGGEKVIENEVSPQDFYSTIAHALNLDIDKEVHSATKRPFTLRNGGSPLLGLF